MTDVAPLGVAVVGFGWMGRVHTQAYVRVPHHFPAAPATTLVAVADDVPGRAAEAAARYGFATATTDWRDLVTDPRIHAVSITVPNFLHREVATAFAAAGKHIWIEKPVGLSAADARAITAPVHLTVGFNYRNAPAVERARTLLTPQAPTAAPPSAPAATSLSAPAATSPSAPAAASPSAPAATSLSAPASAYPSAPTSSGPALPYGQIGNVTHARFRFFSDYAAHPEGALSWRFERTKGGNGVLGDLGAHAVDLVRYLLGEIDSLVADTAVFVPSRPRPTVATAGHQRGSGPPGAVENEDYVGALLRMRSGARVVLEASRVAVGEQNSYGFEIHGTRGALFWDFRRMGELRVAAGDAFQDEPVRKLLVAPGDGDFAAFQPGAGIPMSYDDLKVIEAHRFLQSITDGVPRGATLTDAIRSAEALEALEHSAATGTWVTLDH